LKWSFNYIIFKVILLKQYQIIGCFRSDKWNLILENALNWLIQPDKEDKLEDIEAADDLDLDDHEYVVEASDIYGNVHVFNVTKDWFTMSSVPRHIHPPDVSWMYLKDLRKPRHSLKYIQWISVITNKIYGPK